MFAVLDHSFCVVNKFEQLIHDQTSIETFQADTLETVIFLCVMSTFSAAFIDLNKEFNAANSKNPKLH